MAIHQTDPDALLRQLSRLPAEQPRGKLRIYFGYAAGVGKTFAMLSSAREAQKNGMDVVVGYVEPHGRPETAALLEGLEVLSPLKTSSRGAQRKEFDLDRALRLSPDILLVDELAHANAEGCRHKKRYQDVEELLQAGIDVYTTVDVQQLESLNDIVASITGVPVAERVPDSVFDQADQVELVDIEPDHLLKRFHTGKIYREGREKQALLPFFTREKLTALREIALRCTADQIGRAASRQAAKDAGADRQSPPTYGNEHILVCLSPAPSNACVIRAAARMADAFHGAFTALFVDTAGTRRLKEKSRLDLRKNLRLAEQLGAQIATVYGEDIPGQIAEYARASRVSKIVMGRSDRGKRWFSRSNYVDRLISLAPNLDIYIIPDTEPTASGRAPRFSRPPRPSPADVAKSAGILAACTAIALWFSSLGYNEANIITVYILGVLLIAIVTPSWIYSTASSVLSVVVFDLVFTAPRLSLRTYTSGHPITFLVMLSAALITSTLMERVKKQAHQSAQKAYRTEVLLETSQKLQQAKDEESILSETARQMVKLLDRTVVFYPARHNTLSGPLAFPKDGTADAKAFLGTQERAVAEWVYKNNRRAGATTNTLSAAGCLYFAVRGGHGVLAVAAIAMDRKVPLEAFEKNLTIAMLEECALALEKERLNESQKQISIRIRQEQLRANLLRTISHDLRTPLTSISGNAGILMKNSGALSEERKKSLFTDIYDDSMWLISMVENLLAITRFDNGTLNLNLQPELLEEVIAEALRHVSRNAAEHEIKTAVDGEFLMAKMDSHLIVQVLINLVNNAIQHTPAGSHIAVSARREGREVLVEVSDDGPGIPGEAKSKLFDMFYTAGNARGDGRRGLGLGLYLCKSIICAHGGKIGVKDNSPHGTVFRFTLQAAEVNIHE